MTITLGGLSEALVHSAKVAFTLDMELGGTTTFTVLRESCTLHTFTVLRQNALTFTHGYPHPVRHMANSLVLACAGGMDGCKRVPRVSRPPRVLWCFCPPVSGVLVFLFNKHQKAKHRAAGENGKSKTLGGRAGTQGHRHDTTKHTTLGSHGHGRTHAIPQSITGLTSDALAHNAKP
jgi:hypothetical protein